MIKIRQLPIAGKNVLMRNLDELMSAGIKQAIVIATNQANEIQKWIGQGQRWGIDMKVEVFRYCVNAAEVIKLFSCLADQSGLLVVNANILRNNCLITLVEQARQKSLQHSSYTVSENDIGVTYLEHSKFIDREGIIDLDPHVVKVNQLNNYQDYFDANMDILCGNIKGQKPDAKEKNTQGVFLHHHTHIHRGCNLSSEVMIGEHCHVSDKTTLKNVVLNQDVYIDRFSVLDNVVVLPGTYLKKKSCLSNVIVTPNRIIELAA